MTTSYMKIEWEVFAAVLQLMLYCLRLCGMQVFGVVLQLISYYQRLREKSFTQVMKTCTIVAWEVFRAVLQLLLYSFRS